MIFYYLFLKNKEFGRQDYFSGITYFLLVVTNSYTACKSSFGDYKKC